MGMLYETNIEKRTTFNEDLVLLVKHAEGDTGGSRRCAAFILSLWNGRRYRADLQELLYIDAGIHMAMMRVFHELYSHGWQLDDMLIEPEALDNIIEMWGLEFEVESD